MASVGNDEGKRERFSIYLVKPGIDKDEALLKTENAKAPIHIECGDGKAVLYIKKESPKPPPSWTKLFTTLPTVPEDSFGSTNSVGAVLIYRAKRTFLLSFGHGFHLIKDEAVERDFGLRVTLNSVEPAKLRSLDKASYDHNPLNSRTQSSREVDIFDLAVDSELEMLYAVTGASKEPVLGTHVTGRDALTVMVHSDVAGMPAILSTALAKYNEKLSPEFEWVDNISRVRDQDELGVLDLYLDDALAGVIPATLWLGEPEIVDWESQLGYSFDLRANTSRHVVLELDDLAKYLAQKGLGMTVEVLKAQVVHVNNQQYEAIKSWQGYRCLYAELSVGSEQYVLRNGSWYRIHSDFVKKVDEFLVSLPICAYPFPTYAHDREEEYNLHVATVDTGFFLMDKKNTALGGRYDKIEFCDLIRTNSTLVHVKYYRSSATLSHLFAQGNVASEAFIKDEDFRVRLNSKLPRGLQLADPKARPDASKYTVVYAIATSKLLPVELPFFSKVTLRNALRTLRALGFQVELATIPIDPAFLKKVKCKPNNAVKAK